MNNQVTEHLLDASDITLNDLHATLNLIQAHDNEFADLYFQASQHEAWVLEDGIIKDGSFSIERGVGVRGVSGEKTGFAYSDELSVSALTAAATAARSITNIGNIRQAAPFKAVSAPDLYSRDNPLLSLDEHGKIDLLQTVDAYIRKQAPNASQVVVSLTGVYEEILVAATDGTLATDIRPLIRLNCTVLLGKRWQARAWQRRNGRTLQLH